MAADMVAAAFTALLGGLFLFALYVLFKFVGKVVKRWSDEEPK